MVDISKLTPEQVKLFNEMKVGGLNQEELDKLAKAGVAKELLEAMKTEFPATGEIPSSEPKFPEEKGPKFWENPVGYFKRDDVSGFEKGALAVAGLTALGFVGWGVAAALGVKGLITLGAAGVLFTACSQKNVAIAGVDYEDKDEETNELLRQLIALVQEGNNNDQVIIALLKKSCDTTEAAYELLKQLNLGMDKVISLLVQFGAKADEIIELIKVNNEQQDIIIDSLSKGNEEIAKLLNEIINLTSQGNMLSETNNTLLTEILAKIGTSNDAEAIKLLKEILEKVTESVKNEKDMDAKANSLLQSILENIQNLNGDMKTGFTNIVDLLTAGNKIAENTYAKLEEVLAKLGKMNANQQAGFVAVLNALEGLGNKADAILDAILNGDKLTQEQLDVIIKNQNIQNANFESLKELIMKNNEIAQGTQDAVKDLSTKMTEEHKAILDSILKGNATLYDIQIILEAIKGDTSQIGDIKQFMNVIGTALEKLLEEVQGLRAETKQGLLAILAKIPDGCKCEPTDLSDLLAKLEIIIQELQSDPGDDIDNPKHEGVLDDLDDFFG